MANTPINWRASLNFLQPFTPSYWKRQGEAARAKKAKETARLPRPAAPTVVRQYEDHPSNAYMELKYLYRDIGRMRAISETLGRDFLTAMPEGAWRSRLGQIGFVHRRIHEEIASANMANLIESAKSHAENHPEDWDEWDRANLREMDDLYQHHAPLDAELMERRARLIYEGRRQHRDCLSSGDWPQARTFLSNIIDMNKQMAEAKCKVLNISSPYQALMSEYMPGLSVETLEGWLTETETRVSAMLPQILEKQAKSEPPLSIKDFYPAKAQMWLNHAMLTAIGFDFTRGGLYETGHNPVEGGTPDDTRLVIKHVDINNFLDSLKSAMHEGGHGIYVQGLPRSTWRYQPVGQDMGAAVQESQALIIEMIMGRTQAFFDYLAPRVEGLFHGLGNPVLKADNLHRLKTWVKPAAFRRSADEVTYFLHIMHRYRLERDLIEDRLKIGDLPEAWNTLLEEKLGFRPQGFTDGCLQDVHWFVGKFGYFPSYAVGHMLAAQMYSEIRKSAPGLDASIAAGDFTPLTYWLRDRIHAKGRLLSFNNLIRQSTGRDLTPQALLTHLENRYLKSTA